MRLFVAGCALVVASASPISTWAQPQKPSDAALAEARTRYERGTKLYDEGAFEPALVELQRAYDLAPAASILYNIGLVHLARNDYGAALRAFRKYLADGGDKVSASRRAEVEKRLAELVMRVAHVTVKSEVAGADVLVDDAAVGTTPLQEPLLLNIGRHKLVVTKEGMIPSTQTVTVAGGDVLTVPLDPQPQPAPERPVEPGPKPRVAPRPSSPPRGDAAPPRRPSSKVWIGWTAAGVLGAGAIATGIAAFAASRDLDALRAHPNPSVDDLTTTGRRVKTLALVTDLLGVAALGTAGVTLYFTLKTDAPAHPVSSAALAWRAAF